VALASAAKRPRHALQLPPQARRGEVAVVAREQFVAAIARQRDRDLLAGEAADEVGRDLRRIGERLVIHGRQRAG
jgi:hypothetical protein